MSVNSKYQITFRGVKLGDHAYLTLSYSGNTDERVIPRAKGMKLWSTYELGGGLWNIRVDAFVAKSSRISLEQYFYNLDSSISLNESGSIVVTDTSTSTSYTLTNCYLKSYSQENSDFKFNSFTFDFVKSI